MISIVAFNNFRSKLIDFRSKSAFIDRPYKEKIKKEFFVRLVNFSVLVIRKNKPLRSDPDCRIVIDQLNRSATSVGANIIEAQSASSKKDFIKFFQIALKSANESIYWLIILEKISGQKQIISSLINENKQIAKIIASSLLTLKGKK